MEIIHAILAKALPPSRASDEGGLETRLREAWTQEEPMERPMPEDLQGLVSWWIGAHVAEYTHAALAYAWSQPHPVPMSGSGGDEVTGGAFADPSEDDESLVDVVQELRYELSKSRSMYLSRPSSDDLIKLYSR
jgi:hypothetical protein